LCDPFAELSVLLFGGRGSVGRSTGGPIFQGFECRGQRCKPELIEAGFPDAEEITGFEDPSVAGHGFQQDLQPGFGFLTGGEFVNEFGTGRTTTTHGWLQCGTGSVLRPTPNDD
jgi:hypothetical protein